ncbi:MAG: site-2 protease family protein [Epsilonproteobacteria bacterium]|nr:site-2 protease family protein [Campylobacterota bacterium]
MSSMNITQIVASILALMIAIIGHEIMHGLVAHKYGDDTAKNAGRLSINPLVHIDPVGTIILPALLFFSGAPFMFGWAKPVPIDIRTVLRNGGYNAAIAVSLAGITYNFFLAIVASFIFPYFNIQGSFIGYLLYTLVVYNVVLGFFNLYPIPPLDGAHALEFFSKKMGWDSIAELLNKMERYGMIILIIFLATPLSDIFFYPAIYVIDILLN